MNHNNSELRIFDRVAAEWKIISETSEIRPASRVSDQLSFLTFNLWLEEPFKKERTSAVLAILQESDPDIIALQEVTSPVLHMLLKNDFIRRHYAIARQSRLSQGSYETIVLSKLPVKRVYSVDLPGLRERQLVVADLCLGDEDFRVGAVHLESKRESAPERAAQLDIVFRELAEASSALLIGDLNFCASWHEENELIESDYRDLWELASPQDPGFTENTKINLMRLDYKGKKKMVRFDRVLLRTPRIISNVSSALLGTEPIHSDLPRVFPSDHFGVYVCCMLNPVL